MSREKVTLKHALSANGYGWQILYERLGCPIGKWEFKQCYLKATCAGEGRVWDRVMEILDDLGVDW